MKKLNFLNKKKLKKIYLKNLNLKLKFLILLVKLYKIWTDVVYTSF